MHTFRSAVSDYVRLSKRRETARCTREATEKKAKAGAIAKCRAPFQAAAAKLEALMRGDPDFRKFLKERIATIRHCDGATYRWITSTTFGQHNEQDGWVGEMTPTYEQVKTEWHLTADVLEKGKVELEIHNNSYPYSLDPADVPDQVLIAFRPVLKVLQDEKKVYDFLLEKFGV